MQKIGDIAGSNADTNGEWTAGDPAAGRHAAGLGGG